MFDQLFSRAGLSLDRLRSLLEIAAAKGIARAAGGDPSRQSQLSRQLAELEDYFGAELIRRGRGVSFGLTQTGEHLKNVVTQAFRGLEETRCLESQKAVSITIGAGESVLTSLVIPTWLGLRAAAHKFIPTFLNLRSEAIFTKLADGSLDVGVVRRQNMPSGLRSTPLASFNFVLAAPFSLWPKGMPIVEALAKVPLAVLEGSSSQEEITATLAMKRPFVEKLRCSSYEQAIAAMDSLRCGAILPAFAVSPDTELHVERLSVPPMKLLIVTNPSVLKLRPLAQEALRLVLEALPKAATQRAER